MIKNNKEILNHLAIIMDGNGRWAEKQNKPRLYGHKNGIYTVEKVIKYCLNCNIKFLTLFALSTENLLRPKKEINFIISLAENFILNKKKFLMQNDISLNVIGDLTFLKPYLKNSVSELIKKTKSNSSLQLTIAFNYGSRWEIIKAIKSILSDITDKNIKADSLNENLFEKYLETHAIPDPDLLIRTAGEYRLSNFLLWQLAYTEIYISEKLWPDFNIKDLDKAIEEFYNRERRYGLTTDQLKKIN